MTVIFDYCFDMNLDLDSKHDTLPDGLPNVFKSPFSSKNERKTAENLSDTLSFQNKTCLVHYLASPALNDSHFIKDRQIIGIITPWFCIISIFSDRSCCRNGMPFQSYWPFELGPYCSQISLLCQLG